MEVPERFYGSVAEGFKQLSEVLEVQRSPLSEAKASDRFPLRLIFRGSRQCPGVHSPPSAAKQ